MVTAALKLKDTCSLERSHDNSKQCIKKQRHHFGDKGPCSQSYSFSSSHTRIWQLVHTGGWVLKNWYLRIVVLKTLESHLDYNQIKPINPKGNQPWIFLGRTNTEAEAPILWLLDVKSWFIGKYSDARKHWRPKEKGNAEDKMFR